MPRKPRQESATGTYHVMARGLNKAPVFKESREKARILNLIRENLANFNVEIYAYCVMLNHLHVLIKGDLKELSSFMAKILAAYAHYYNYKHNRVGYVFQDRYKSQCVENPFYFWNCLRYIHRNPSKAGNIEDLLNYRYSSMSELYYEKPDILHNNVLIMKGERFPTPQDFLDFHKMDSRDIFADVEEDIAFAHMRIGKEVLAEMQRKTGTQSTELLEYVVTRNKYEQQLVDILGVSRKKAQEIEQKIKKELKGTG